MVDRVIESISGEDLVALRKEGKQPPEFERGNLYKINGKEQLCYWTMGGVRGKELSYVNNPSDEHAANIKKDIGQEGMQLLLGQRKGNEFAFYDALSLEEVLSLSKEEYFAFAESSEFIDSQKTRTYFNLNSNTVSEINKSTATEETNESIILKVLEEVLRS
jgi:hypothetical protein